MNRDNHYEAAFEAYLRGRGVPYVAVDEAKRALLGGESIKSLDFIVSTAAEARWLVDVKGRLFPSGVHRQYWKNWSTRDDLRGLAQWERLFGQSFRGLLVFAYQIAGNRSPLPTERLFAFRDRLYVPLMLNVPGGVSRPERSTRSTSRSAISYFRSSGSWAAAIWV